MPTYDPKYGYRPFPDWFDGFREYQEDTINEVREHFARGTKIVFLNAPTGSGKSIIGEAVGRLNGGTRLYTCTTKALQDQFVKDFDYGLVVKGRSNYLTQSGKVDEFGNTLRRADRPSAITCADCTYTAESDCRWCLSRAGCPYQVAKKRATEAELAILNSAYFLTDSNMGGRGFTGRNTVILDEADLLESEILNMVEVNVSRRQIERMNLDPPKRKTVPRYPSEETHYGIRKRKETWGEWVTKVGRPTVDKYLETLPVPWEEGVSQGQIREYQATHALAAKMKILEKELPNGGWVYDGYNDGNIIFRPVEVKQWGEQMVWPHGKQFLLMSATILSPDLMAEQLGMEEGSYAYVDMPSTFPKENRPIFIVPVADMVFRLKDEEWPKLVRGVQAVIDRHPDERILVHTVSYELARYLHSHLIHRRPVFTYDNSRDKDDALRSYKRMDNSVLLAASMDRGIDLPGELCTVQVVCKIPFPNLKDKRVDARLHMVYGTEWYRMNAIRTMIQMTGRGVRSKTDTCTTYILDKQFISNIWKSKHLLPSWWVEAVRMDLGPRKLGIQ